MSRFDLLQPPSIAEGLSRVRSARIDRARPRFFICHFIFIILPARCHRSARNGEKEGYKTHHHCRRRRWRPSPDTDRKHTSLPTATCIPHNVRARPRLYDTANNRSWYQADIIQLYIATAWLDTRESADTCRRVNRAAAALRGSIRNQETQLSGSNQTTISPACHCLYTFNMRPSKEIKRYRQSIFYTRFQQETQETFCARFMSNFNGILLSLIKYE